MASTSLGMSSATPVLGEDEEGDPICEPCEDNGVDSGEDQEVEPLKTAPDSKLPSEAEVEDHRCDHTPYRSWCIHCRRGRGLGEHRGSDHERNLPLLSMDYFFLTRDGLLKKEEIIGKLYENEDALNQALETGDVVKCLLLRDMRSKAVFGWVVPSKGNDADGYVVDVLAEAIRWLGYTRLILKSDNEPAIAKLLTDVMAAVRVNVE